MHSCEHEGVLDGAQGPRPCEHEVPHGWSWLFLACTFMHGGIARTDLTPATHSPCDSDATAPSMCHQMYTYEAQARSILYMASH